MENFIAQVYVSVFGFFATIMNIIFTPIDTLISSIIPDYTNLSTYITAFFDYFRDIFLWAISWLNIPKPAFSLILGYITFRVLLFFGTMSFKLFVRWYTALKV